MEPVGYEVLERLMCRIAIKTLIDYGVIRNTNNTPTCKICRGAR